jgi:enoyl-CoA hydratase/carnithine racemase
LDTKFGDYIAVNLRNRVALVTIDRAPHNHASVGMLRGLADALEALDGDPACRAVVLATAGRVFCAGADFASRRSNLDDGGGGLSGLYEQATRLFAVATPMVAAVQGPAVGAGLGLALVADFRVAAPEARFVANFVKLGLHPGFGLTYTLPRLIGVQRAQLMLLTGRRVKPDDALRWNLVDEIAPADELLTASLRLARELAENAPLSVLATRRALRRDLAETVRRHIVHEREQQMILRTTHDFVEGRRAVAERRPGNFIGA